MFRIIKHSIDSLLLQHGQHGVRSKRIWGRAWEGACRDQKPRELRRDLDKDCWFLWVVGHHGMQIWKTTGLILRTTVWCLDQKRSRKGVRLGLGACFVELTCRWTLRPQSRLWDDCTQVYRDKRKGKIKRISDNFLFTGTLIHCILCFARP